MKDKKFNLRDNMYEFNEDDEKEPIRMFSWFTSEKLDKKTYVIFLIILASLYVLGYLPRFLDLILH